jgi:7-carboxy-7-deazaguanine synthase (Cx14CxxC type)
MTYAVKEVFHTLQGEGLNAGRAAVFLRFSGCNLWSGLAKDRGKGPGGCSAWCDTQFVGTDGVNGGKYESAVALAQQVAATWRGGPDRRFVVCTGGEPLLQLDEALVDALHNEGFEVAVETNGTQVAPRGIDWICVSPKKGGTLTLRSGHELKFVGPQDGLDPREFEGLDFRYFLLQPMDGPNRERNARWALDFCLTNARWRIGLQAHKYLGIP